MNLSPDSPAFRSAIEAARRADCGRCAALAGDECVYTTTPAALPVTAGTPVRPVRGYHAGRLALAGNPVPGLPPVAIVWDNGDEPRLPDGADDIAGEIDAIAAALLSGKITALREYVGRALGDERHDWQEALERVAGELTRVSVILAAAVEGDDEEDDAEPYCLTCGEWVHMFHGVEGWRHFRGEGTAASPVVLYDAGHEPAVRPARPGSLPWPRPRRAGGCRVRRGAAASRRAGRRGGAVSRRARPEPGVVEVRLSGAAEDTATVISVLERLAAGLPVTTVGLEIVHRSGARPGRRDPGERMYVLVRVLQDGGAAREP